METKNKITTDSFSGKFGTLFVVATKEDKLTFTIEELGELLNKAYDNGYSDGYKNGMQSTPPSLPNTPYTPNNPQWPYPSTPIWCGTGTVVNTETPNVHVTLNGGKDEK